ncbi:hypothetical protein Ais01nite_21910 [Asanoa ishikariensis]|nr:hypothetical protein Ais01nite_21910 [Asanoa ishikariensis]
MARAVGSPGGDSSTETLAVSGCVGWTGKVRYWRTATARSSAVLTNRRAVAALAYATPWAQRVLVQFVIGCSDSSGCTRSVRHSFGAGQAAGSGATVRSIQ